ELRHRAQPVPAVGACPDIIFWYRWYGFRPKIGPVKSCELLHRIGCMLDREREHTPRRFRRSLQTIAFRVIEPAMISACDAAFFDSAVGKRGAAVRTAVLQKAQLALLAFKQHQIFTQDSYEFDRVLIGEIVCNRYGMPITAQQFSAGVPGPTRVSISFSSAVSIGFSSTIGVMHGLLNCHLERV